MKKTIKCDHTRESLEEALSGGSVKVKEMALETYEHFVSLGKWIKEGQTITLAIDTDAGSVQVVQVAEPEQDNPE